MKRINIKFTRPLEWEEARDFDFGIDPLALVYVGKGGAHKIYGIRCYEKYIKKVASKLKMQKVAFKIDK